MNLVDMVRQRYSEFFDERPALSDEARQNCQEIIECSKMAYFRKLDARLLAEIDKPALVGDHMEMVKASVRANTMKEIRAWFRADLEAAENMLRQERENG